MFDIIAIKQKQGKRKIMRPSNHYIINSFERPLPYYSTVPEQKWTNDDFLRLKRKEKGDYCLLVDFLWRGCGAMRRCDISRFATDLDMSVQELTALIKKLLQSGLLMEVQDWLIQPELREQYLHVCRIPCGDKDSASVNKDSGLEEPF